MKFTIFTARTAFLSAQLSSVNYIYIIVKQISRTFSTCKSETTYPLNINSSFIKSLWIL